MDSTHRKYTNNPHLVDNHLRHIHGSLQCFFSSLLDCLWSVSGLLYEGDNKIFIQRDHDSFLNKVSIFLESDKHLYIKDIITLWPGDLEYDTLIPAFDKFGNERVDKNNEKIKVRITNFLLKDLLQKKLLAIHTQNNFTLSIKYGNKTGDLKKREIKNLGFRQGDSNEALFSLLGEVFDKDPKGLQGADKILYELCSFIHCKAEMCGCSGIKAFHSIARFIMPMTGEVNESLDYGIGLRVCLECYQHVQIIDIHETLPTIFFVRLNPYVNRKGGKEAPSALLKDFDFEEEWTKSDIGRIKTGRFSYSEDGNFHAVEGNTQRYKMMALSYHDGKSGVAHLPENDGKTLDASKYQGTSGHYQTLCRNKDFDMQGELGSWLNVSDGRVTDVFKTYKEGFEKCILKGTNGRSICALAVYQLCDDVKRPEIVANEIANGLMSRIIQREFQKSLKNNNRQTIVIEDLFQNS